MATQWNYRVQPLVDESGKPYEVTSQIEEKLDEMGQDGWEFVAFTPDGHAAVMRRPRHSHSSD